MSGRDLQFGFSAAYGRTVLDKDSRRQKAEKVVAVLADHLGDLGELRALDVGCSLGNSTIWYAKRFRRTAAIDIDLPAVARAGRENSAPRLSYGVMSGQELAFADESFDVVICTHVYEHVPDARALLQEIWRLLKPGGVCFFSAGNRLQLVEPHYRLPALSIVPRWMASWYLRMLGRGRFYYEKHLTYWGLRRLVAGFDLIDYTVRVVTEPARFAATDVVEEGSRAQRFALFALRWAYWTCPTYVWLLRKPPSGTTRRSREGV